MTFHKDSFHQKKTPSIQFWFLKPDILTIVNLNNGKLWDFKLEKTSKDDRFDYSHTEYENILDPDEVYGSNGFKRMRIWEKELKFDDEGFML
jgi:hypothetical protein